jgi:hypothetical protein
MYLLKVVFLKCSQVKENILILKIKIYVIALTDENSYEYSKRIQNYNLSI